MNAKDGSQDGGKPTAGDIRRLIHKKRRGEELSSAEQELWSTNLEELIELIRRS